MKFLISASLFLVRSAFACSSCYGPTNQIEHVRHVKRMQPGAANATYGPTRSLEVSIPPYSVAIVIVIAVVVAKDNKYTDLMLLQWGQLNFLHTVGEIQHSYPYT